MHFIVRPAAEAMAQSQPPREAAVVRINLNVEGACGRHEVRLRAPRGTNNWSFASLVSSNSNSLTQNVKRTMRRGGTALRAFRAAQGVRIMDATRSSLDVDSRFTQTLATHTHIRSVENPHRSRDTVLARYSSDLKMKRLLFTTTGRIKLIIFLGRFSVIGGLLVTAVLLAATFL